MISRLFSKMFGLFRNIVYFLTGKISKTGSSLDKNKTVVKEKFESIIEQKEKILSQLKESFNNTSVQTIRYERDLELQNLELSNASKIAEKALVTCSKYVSENNNDPNIANSEKYNNYKLVYERALALKKEKTDLLEKYKKLHNASLLQENNIKNKINELKKNIDSLNLKKESLLKNMELKESIDAISVGAESLNLSYLEKEEKKLQDLALEMEVYIKNHDQDSNSSLENLEKQLLAEAEKDVVFDEFDKMVGLVKESKTQSIENITPLNLIKNDEILVEVIKE